jgi:hypothetical protein
MFAIVPPVQVVQRPRDTQMGMGSNIRERRNMRHIHVATAVVLLAGSAFSGWAIAADRPIEFIKAPPPDSIVPQSAFFVGLGGSWNSVNFNNQNVYGKGTSYTPPFVDVMGPQPAITGSAAGSTDFTLDSKSALAPSIQAGYFQHFSGSQWMWGGKFSYSYLGIGSATNLLIPQAGGFQQGATFTPFTGNYVVRSYRQTLENQISLIPFIGQSFERSYLYLGAGPTVAQTKTSIDSITGFADINGLISSITGIGFGSSYSTSQWIWGGIATVGATYFIDRTWFVDASYSYAMTGTKTSNWGGPWSFNPVIGGPRSGTNTGTSTGSVNTQSFTVSINKAF